MQNEQSEKICRLVKMFKPAIFTFIIFLASVSSSQQNPGVLDKIKTGLEYASSYIETAKEIADLVAESLGHGNHRKRGDDGEKSDKIFGKKKENFRTQGLADAFFRLLGLDSPKINAIAVNSAIFLAQMIGTAFNVKPKIEKSRGMGLESEDIDVDEKEEEEEGVNWAKGPMQLILGSANERIQHLVRQAQDKNLPTHLVERVDGLDTACIRLLVCKASPVIWAAQRSLDNDNGRAKWDMTSWLPSKNEFVENGDKCEANHNTCRIFPET